MKLPQIAYQTYEMTSAISKNKIKYRPFLTGEEKILYLAQKTGDNKQIKDAVIQVLNNCIITPGVIAEELSVFDLEKLLLSVRAKAVGEVIDVQIPCDLEPEDNGQPVYVPVKINIEDILVHIPPDHTNKIEVNENTTLVMKYPGLDDFLLDNFIDEDSQKNMFEITLLCLDKLVVGDEIYDFNDASDDDLNGFLDSMPTKIFDKITNFFTNPPKLYHDVVVYHPVSGNITKLRLEGIQAFF
jgi:hypothetical protein